MKIKEIYIERQIIVKAMFDKSKSREDQTTSTITAQTEGSALVKKYYFFLTGWKMENRNYRVLLEI